MLFITGFTPQLLKLTLLIAENRINQAHIRIWLRIYNPNMNIERLPDPRDQDEMDVIQHKIDLSLEIFLERVISECANLYDTRPLTQEEGDALCLLAKAFTVFFEGCVARQNTGEDGWMHLIAYFMEAVSEGTVTPETLEVLIRSITPRPVPGHTTLDA